VSYLEWGNRVKKDDSLSPDARRVLFTLQGKALEHGECDMKFIGDPERVAQQRAPSSTDTQSGLEEAHGSGYLELRGDIVRLILP